MSEMIVIDCDFKEGCPERFAGFATTATEKFKEEYLHSKDWLVQEGKHYCPLHKEQALKEAEKE